MGCWKVEIACVDLPFEEFYCERELRDGLITGGGCQVMCILNFHLLDVCFKIESVRRTLGLSLHHRGAASHRGQQGLGWIRLVRVTGFCQQVGALGSWF